MVALTQRSANRLTIRQKGDLNRSPSAVSSESHWNQSDQPEIGNAAGEAKLARDVWESLIEEGVEAESDTCPGLLHQYT